MSSLRFPFRSKETNLGPVPVFLVRLDVRTITGEYWPSNFMLDTGADFSVIPAAAAEIFGIDEQASTRLTLRGISPEPVPCRTGTLTVRMDQDGPAFQLRCVVPEMPFRHLLLGRLDFFDRYSVNIDMEAGAVVVIPRPRHGGE